MSFHTQLIWRNDIYICESMLKVLTAPVSVPTVERSFSIFKLNTTFHSTTTTDERVTDLAMACIESEIAQTLDIRELIKIFAFLKARIKLFF